MSEILSQENLQIIWFVLWGLLWAVYFVLDGFDLGLGILLPFITRNNSERRVIYNAAGPFWDGNEVWLITAGGVTFAAFPKAYAVMFSALYAPLLIILFALIFRAVSFEFRNKINSPSWQRIWDCFQFIGNFIPALLFGVAFANLFMGIQINAKGVYTGTILTLLNPYGIAGGLLFVLIFALHGTLWLAIRSEGEIHKRALKTAPALWLLVLIFTVAFLAMSYNYTPLYNNYFANPLLWIFPALAVVALLGVLLFIMKDCSTLAFVSNGLFILCVTFFGVFGMFPSLIPAADPANSITIMNSASQPLTLKLMLYVSLVCVPVVICYQAWAYTVFSHKITDKELDSEHAY